MGNGDDTVNHPCLFLQDVQENLDQNEIFRRKGCDLDEEGKIILNLALQKTDWKIVDWTHLT
jgi:hypothetical protein